MGEVIVLPVVRIEREPPNRPARDAVAFYFAKMAAGESVPCGNALVPLSDPDLFLAWLAEEGFGVVARQ